MGAAARLSPDAISLWDGLLERRFFGECNGFSFGLIGFGFSGGEEEIEELADSSSYPSSGVIHLRFVESWLFSILGVYRMICPIIYHAWRGHQNWPLKNRDESGLLPFCPVSPSLIFYMPNVFLHGSQAPKTRA